MSSLHIISSQQSDALAQCLALCSSSDAIFFYSDGVSHCLKHQPLAEIKAKGVKLYALEDDLHARGLELEPELFTLADYALWVELSAAHKNCLNWS